MLSAVLIVKNEEQYLSTCLDSVKDADEIVVMDTGSTDRTIEIAETYTDNVYTCEWQDDFAKARNYAKAHCNGEWVYNIDADHVNLTPFEQIRAEIERVKDHDVASITIDGHHQAAWLYRNKPELQWVGRVHEVLNRPASAHTSIAQRTRKRPEAHTKRNIRLLQKSEDSPRTRFYLGREYFELGDYSEAVRWLRRYLKAPAFPAEQAEAWITLAKAYWYSNRGADARAACLQAIGTNPDFREALEWMAHMTYEPLSSKWKRLAEQSKNSDVLFNRYPSH